MTVSDFVKWEKTVNVFGVGYNSIVAKLNDPIEKALIEQGLCSGAYVAPVLSSKGWKQYFRIVWQPDTDILKSAAEKYVRARHEAVGDIEFFRAVSSLKLGEVHFYALFNVPKGIE
jgi:hypothetical protein